VVDVVVVTAVGEQLSREPGAEGHAAGHRTPAPLSGPPAVRSPARGPRRGCDEEAPLATPPMPHAKITGVCAVSLRVDFAPVDDRWLTSNVQVRGPVAYRQRLSAACSRRGFIGRLLVAGGKGRRRDHLSAPLDDRGRAPRRRQLRREWTRRKIAQLPKAPTSCTGPGTGCPRPAPSRLARLADQAGVPPPRAGDGRRRPPGSGARSGRRPARGGPLSAVPHGRTLDRAAMPWSPLKSPSVSAGARDTRVILPTVELGGSGCELASVSVSGGSKSAGRGIRTRLDA
jgi:hypothetical protein